MVSKQMKNNSPKKIPQTKTHTHIPSQNYRNDKKAEVNSVNNLFAHHTLLNDGKNKLYETIVFYFREIKRIKKEDYYEDW